MSEYNYEAQQIDRLIADGPDPESGGVYRLKLWSANEATKTLSVTPAQFAAIRAILTGEA